jgi:tetratricopeptide (TPR) repeat protein
MPVRLKGDENMNIEKEKEKAFIQKRAKAAVISRDFALAARLYKNLLKDDSGNIGLLSALGSLYVKTGDDKKALFYYEQIRALSSNNFEALNSMGGIYRRLQKYDESITVLQQALSLGLNDAQVYYNLGFTYRSMGAYDEAIECFKTVIDENSNDVLAYNHLGAIYALRRDHQKAVAAYRRGLQVDPNHPVLQFNLAKSYEALQDDKKAGAAYEAALRAKPGWLEAVRDYSELLLRHHKTKDAADLVKKSILLYPDDIGIQNLLGHIYLKQYDYDSAMQTFEKACRIDGNNTNVLTGLAEAYEKNDKAKDAVEVMMKAEQVQPDDTAITRQYAHALLSADDSGTAAAKIKKAYDKNKNDVQTLDLYGQYYICRNEDDKANLVYSKINKIDSSYDEYKKEASGRYKQTGRLDKARRTLEQYLSKHPEDPAGLIALAGLDEASGDIPAALADYNEAIRHDQYNVLAHLAARRLSGVVDDINEQHRKDQEIAGDENNEREIVMDVPEEKEPEVVPVQESDQNDELFDFDSMGDSLLKEDDEQDPFALSDEEDEENEEDDDPRGLDKLIPADQPIDLSGNEKDNQENAQDILDGAAGPAGTADQPVSGTADDGFGAENIEEDPDHGLQDQHPLQSEPQESEPVPDSDAGEHLSEPSDDIPASEEEPEMPDPSAVPAQQNTPLQPEKHTAPQASASQYPDVSGDSLREIAAAMNRTNAAGDFAMATAQRTYDAAEHAARRAWDAARQAADSAQSADDAVDHINKMSSDTVMKAAQAAVQKVHEAAEAAAAKLDEKQQNLLQSEETDAGYQELQETTSAESSNADIPERENEVSSADYDAMIDTAAGMLPDIVAMLENKENAEKFMTELELFKKLRILCEYLPLDKKEVFMSSRTRLLLDYVIAKLSGEPGLMATAAELRKTKLVSRFLETDRDRAPHAGISGRPLARIVIADMRSMIQDLSDAHLAKALDDCAVEALRTL